MLNKQLVFVLVIGDLLLAEKSGRVTHEDLSLSLSVWEVYSDTVILDWYITLQQKFRMNTCQISYGPTDENNDEEKEIIAIKRTFIPDHRSFQVNSLQRNTSYWLFMTCTDIYGDVYNSSILNFTTEDVDVIQPKYSHIIQDDFQHPRLGIEKVNPRNARPGVVRRRETTLSPHALLGLGCGILLFIICVGTILMVFINYLKYNSQVKTAEASSEPGPPDSPAYGEIKGACSEQMLTISWHCSKQEGDLQQTQQHCSNISLEMGDLVKEQDCNKSNDKLIDI